MKIVQILFYTLLLSFLAASCDNNTPGNQAPSPVPSYDIKVKVLDMNQDPMDMVVISLFNGNLASPIDTTKLNGTATLPEVISSNKYSFQKNNYMSPIIEFDVLDNLDALFIYLTKYPRRSPKTLLTGTVYNNLNNSIPNVTVQSDTLSTQTNSNGVYSLWIPYNVKAPAFPVTYKQNGISAALGIDADQDTVLVDVYIDGFSVDSVFVKEKK